jgi:hypothetical protein
VLLEAAFLTFMGKAAPPLFLKYAQSTPPSLLCVLFNFQFILYIFPFCGAGVSLSRGLCFPRDGCGSTTCCLSTHLLVHISQVGLELVASGSIEALLFSQCNVVWKSPVRAGGSGYLRFASYFFFLSSVALASQQDSRFMELTLSATSL